MVEHENQRRSLHSSSHLLQADSQVECDQWINTLQIAISNSFKSPNGLQSSASVSFNDISKSIDFVSLQSSPKSSSDDYFSNSLVTDKIEMKQKM